jgi:hypothetical protein
VSVVDVEGARATRRAFAVVAAALEDVRAARRYQDRSVTDDDGRHHAKGGIWNDRDHRAAYGIAKADASALRRELRAIGAKVTADEADALLLQAEMGYLRVMSRTKEQERVKKARQRAKARAEGRCSICTVAPARAGLKTCQDCADRVPAWRATKAAS